jgi:hypothetical protein
MRRQPAQHVRQRAPGVGAADEQRRHLDGLDVRPGERRALVADLAEQGKGVVAQLLLRCRRQPPPGAGAIDPIDELRQPALDIAGSDFFGGRGNPRRERGGAGRQERIERGVKFAAGFGEMCPPRECPIRSTGPVSSLSMKPITSATCCAIE